MTTQDIWRRSYRRRATNNERNSYWVIYVLIYYYNFFVQRTVMLTHFGKKLKGLQFLGILSKELAEDLILNV